MDPLFHIVNILPYSVLRPSRLRLKLPTVTIPSAMTVFSLVLLTYLMVVSGVVYDVIVEPPGIGSTQDPRTDTVRPVVFMSGRVNGQYISVRGSRTWDATEEGVAQVEFGRGAAPLFRVSKF